MKWFSVIAAMILVVCLWGSAIAQQPGHGHAVKPPCPNPHAHVQPRPYIYPPIVVPRQNFGYYNPYPYNYQYRYYYNPYGYNYNYQFQYQGPRGFQFRFGW